MRTILAILGFVFFLNPASASTFTVDYRIGWDFDLSCINQIIPGTLPCNSYTQLYASNNILDETPSPSGTVRLLSLTTSLDGAVDAKLVPSWSGDQAYQSYVVFGMWLLGSDIVRQPLIPTVDSSGYLTSINTAYGMTTFFATNSGTFDANLTPEEQQYLLDNPMVDIQTSEYYTATATYEVVNTATPEPSGIAFETLIGVLLMACAGYRRKPSATFLINT